MKRLGEALVSMWCMAGLSTYAWGGAKPTTSVEAPVLKAAVPADAVVEARLPPGAREGYALSEGQKLHYVTMGHGPMVILLHGFADFWYTWRALMPALAIDHQVVAFDMRGYNLSSQPAGLEAYEMPHLLADIDAVAAANDEGYGGDPVLIGHDWGAYIAWRYALAHPERTGGIVALNIPHPLGFIRELQTNPAQQSASAYVQTYLAADAETKIDPTSLAIAPSPAELPIFQTALRRSSLGGMLNYYRANFPVHGDQAFSLPNGGIHKLIVPALLIHGLKDQAILASGLNETWSFMDASVSIETLPDAGHNAHWDDPSSVARLTRSWLARLATDAVVRPLPDVAAALGLKSVTVQEVTGRLERGYGVRSGDLRRSGQLDVVASGIGVSWYEAPSFKRHQISGPEVQSIIAVEIVDVDGDGYPDVVVASGFMQPGGGHLAWYKNPGPERAGRPHRGPWQRFAIADEQVPHRLRIMTVGSERLLVVAPLLAPDATLPKELQATPSPNFLQSNDWQAFDFYRRGAQLHAYRIPKGKAAQLPWTSVPIDASLPLIHGFEHSEWQGGQALFTGSTHGVDVFTPPAKVSEPWHKQSLGVGSQDRFPFTGTGEVRPLHGEHGVDLVAALEPWHGPEVVIYGKDKAGTWRRQVIDTQTELAGHGLAAADLSDRGRDDVLACFFGPHGGLFVYRQIVNAAGQPTWAKVPVELGGVDCQSLSVTKTKGGTSVLTVGDHTHNVRVYEFLRR